MKALHVFVVELEKQINDTIETDSGLSLYVDTRFENGQFPNRVTSGPVVSPPYRYNTGVEVGDELYFHHLVVLNEGQKLTGNDKHFVVSYDPDVALSNQAIAYKSKKDGKIRCLAGWCLLEAIEEEEEEKGIIEIVSLEEKLPTTAKVAYLCEEAKEMGVKEGDVVGFKQNRDYRIKIDGKEYFRTRALDLMYIIE